MSEKLEPVPTEGEIFERAKLSLAELNDALELIQKLQGKPMDQMLIDILERQKNEALKAKRLLEGLL